MGNTVLFVDDEIQILNAIKRELIDEEYNCIFANNGDEALKIIESKEINVIVTDMKMPKMNGLQLLKKVREINPFIVRLVISGYTHLPQVIASINQGYIFKFISKPWKFDEELKPAIDDAIEYYNTIHEIRTSSLNSEIKDELSSKIEEIKDIKNLFIENFAEGTLEQKSKDIYRELFDDYLESLLSEKIEFNINELIHKISHDVGLDTKKIKLEKEKMNIKCFGEYKAIELVIKSLFKYVIKSHRQSSMPIQIDVEECENIVNLNLFTVFDIYRTGIQLSSTSEKQEILRFCGILKKLTKRIHGSIVVYEVGNNLYQKIILPIPLL